MIKLTQENAILEELKKAGSMGLHPSCFIEFLHIYQYSARINGLRKRFNCQCKNGVHCVSSEHIINRRLPNGTTKFFYEKSPDINWEGMRKEIIQKRDEQEILPQGNLFNY